VAVLTRFKFDFDSVFSADANYRGSVAPNWAPLDVQWADGNDANEANLAWSTINNSIANGATESIDLRALAGVFGTTLTMVEVRAILFRAKSGGGLTIKIGGTNGFDALGAAWTLYCPLGTHLHFICPTDGVLVTGASDKTIDIVNASGAAATYDLVVIGTAA
jgi:hypothetical protein